MALIEKRCIKCKDNFFCMHVNNKRCPKCQREYTINARRHYRRKKSESKWQDVIGLIQGYLGMFVIAILKAKGIV